MKEFIIKIDIKVDDLEYETFTWRTRVSDWNEALLRAQRFGQMALAEAGGEKLDTVIVREVEE